MSNTGAICNYSNIDHFDMVRTGAGMLGYNPGIARYDWLKPVLTWRSKVVQVRPLSKGDPVSYSSSWRAPEEGDRKSTRLNSSHVAISYAVFCLKKKTTQC